MRSFLILLVGLLILGFIGFIGYQYYLTTIGKGPVTFTTSAGIKLPRYFPNCDYSNSVLEEGNTLYVACAGGVLVYDTSKSQIVDQIAEPDGLGNSIATSLVKIGDKLYIGTQDGFTIFNLTTRHAQKVSVADGLTSGSNIKLIPDGENIWVLTFDGVNLFNPSTGHIVRYTTQQLDPGANTVNAVNGFVDDKYVYFLEVASSESSGAVIRYNKTTKEIKTFKPDAFGRTDQYARIDFNSIGKFGTKVLISESNHMYMIDEAGDDTWKAVTSPIAFITNDTNGQSNIANVLQNPSTKGILLSTGNKIYAYNPDTDKTSVLFDFNKHFASIMFVNSGSKIWMTPGSDSGDLVSDLNLSTLKVETFPLKDRPVNVGQLAALIDDDAILETPNDILRYSPKDNKFTKISSGVNSFNNLQPIPGFLPIPGTSKIFIISQECGQGCTKPAASIYDWATGQSTPLAISDAALNLFATKSLGGTIYNEFSVSWRNLNTNEIGFATTPSTTTSTKYAVFNWTNNSWSTSTSVTPGSDVFEMNSGNLCNRVYTYSTNGNKFSQDSCTGKVENGNLSWKVADGKLTETNKTNGSSMNLTPPFLAADYSPFPNFYTPRISGIMFVEDKLWISSNLGLFSYDPSTGAYKTYGPSQGLLSKSITGFLVGKYLWVVTDTGGLSILNP